MKKKSFLSLTLVFLLVLAAKLVNTPSIDAFAATTYTASFNNKSLTIDFVDPVQYKGSGVTFFEVAGKVVLYTPMWHYNTTHTDSSVVEYTAKYITANSYKVTGINPQGNSYIKLDEVVLSVPADKTVGLGLSVGDVIGFDFSLNKYSYAVENQDGVRTIINDKNVARGNNVVYYDSTFGDYTKTNQWGYELTARIDAASSSFKVVSFRSLGEGDANGIEIPKDGFVLSGYSSPYQYYLNKDFKYSLDDTLTLVGFNFIDLESSFTHPFTAVDPALDGPGCLNAPSCRSTNQLMIYTDNFAGKTANNMTGTNEWGFEVAVNKNGVVTEMNANVAIPEGGFVLSGHGTENTFLQENVKLGLLVKYDVNTKTITFTDSVIESSLALMDSRLENANNKLNNAITEMYDVPVTTIQADITAIENLYDEMKQLKTNLENTADAAGKMVIAVQLKEKANQTDKLFTDIYYLTLQSRHVDTRGIWHRPSENSLEKIIATLDDLAKNHINQVYVETYWNGYAIFPSQYVDYQPRVKGNFGEYGSDYLKAFISEAHKRNIEVHAWLEDFFVDEGMWNKYPEWQTVNFNGTRIQTGKGTEEGFEFFDPANLEYQQFLIDFYKELVNNYDLDGIQLDYIRYPAGNSTTTYSSGYTDSAVSRFLQESGYNQSSVEDFKKLVSSSSAIYLEWSAWRAEQITNFVKRIHEEVMPLRNNMVLSIAVGPEAANAKSDLLQDWVTWINNGYIDVVEPMAYRTSPDAVKKIEQDLSAIAKNYAFTYTGISPTYNGLPAIYNAYQIVASLEGGAYGSVIFASQNLVGLDDVSYVLTNGTHRDEAISPNADLQKILDVAFSDIISKAERIYIPAGAMTEQQKNDLLTKFNAIKAMRAYNAKDYNLINEELLKLSFYSNSYASGKAADRIGEYLEYLMDIIDIKISRYLINGGYWDLSQTKVRPDVTKLTFPEPPVTPPDDNDNDNTDNQTVTKDNTALIVSVVSGASACVLLAGSYVVFKFRKR